MRMTDFTMIKKLFHITKRNGFSHDEIQTIKNNFGELPQVFIDYYLELGKDERLNHTQDSLIKPEQFQYFKHSEYLIFIARISVPVSGESIGTIYPGPIPLSI